MGGVWRHGAGGQAMVASHHLTVGAVDGEPDGLALVEAQQPDLARRQIQPQRLAARLVAAHMSGQSVGIVQQGAVKGLGHKMIAHGQHDGTAQAPYQHQRQQHMAPDALAQRGGMPHPSSSSR